MVYVVLRNGKCLQYNRAELIGVEDGCMVLRNDQKKQWLVAKLPLDVVERAEFERPCVVRKVKINKNQQDY